MIPGSEADTESFFGHPVSTISNSAHQSEPLTSFTNFAIEWQRSRAVLLGRPKYFR